MCLWYPGLQSPWSITQNVGSEREAVGLAESCECSAKGSARGGPEGVFPCIAVFTPNMLSAQGRTKGEFSLLGSEWRGEGVCTYCIRSSLLFLHLCLVLALT